MRALPHCANRVGLLDIHHGPCTTLGLPCPFAVCQTQRLHPSRAASNFRSRIAGVDAAPDVVVDVDAAVRALSVAGTDGRSEPGKGRIADYDQASVEVEDDT